MKIFRVGDPVVYKKDKVSNRPGPRARDVIPSRRGEDYFYMVPKFWTITEVPDADHVIAVTRTGKHHRLEVKDPHLHKAGLLERLRYRDRFPRVLAADHASSDFRDTSRT